MCRERLPDQREGNVAQRSGFTAERCAEAPLVAITPSLRVGGPYTQGRTAPQALGKRAFDGTGIECILNRTSPTDSAEEAFFLAMHIGDHSPSVRCYISYAAGFRFTAVAPTASALVCDSDSLPLGRGVAAFKAPSSWRTPKKQSNGHAVLFPSNISSRCALPAHQTKRPRQGGVFLESN